MSKSEFSRITFDMTNNEDAFHFFPFQRFPQVVDMYSELTAYLYFSPVAPLTTLGQPPGNVHYIELRMTRSGK